MWYIAAYCGVLRDDATQRIRCLWAINGNAKRKKITYRNAKEKNSKNANSTMNVSAKFHNRNAKGYPTP